ncbi:MAG: DUF1566 domain-containing protein [Colwellia sp.]|uniref:PEP-CTERM sorting domain-containing protein n=1 Tax=Colwellia sp. TaxID=56799 RepID=UPI0025BC35DC|nr:PEP-CTERM sorting domain-containing protein [Colwellia sp.]NQZ28589.1 DUF1566 domain-containing protein [Colwellia sp.]
MRNTFLNTVIAGVILTGCLINNTATAGLIDRGNGMIYDDVQNITWMQDTNYAKTSGYDADGRMNWSDSVAWAGQLEFGGYDDWRLFNASPVCESGDFNCTGNELGHLFYNDFGLEAGDLVGDAAGDPEFDLFSNIEVIYWTADWYDGSYVPGRSNNAWTFVNMGGMQNGYNISAEFHTWAVRDGDVANAIPEPTSVAILSLGLFGLMFSRRSSK